MDNKTPDNKQEFKWTDELVQEFLNDKEHPAYDWSKEISQFKNDKLKEHKVEEKRIEVIDFSIMSGWVSAKADSNECGACYSFRINGAIPQERYEAVKQAIERELNNDTVVEDKIVFDGERVNKYLIDEFGQTGKTEPLRFYSHKRYSQSEVDAIRKEAFEAGRGRYVNQSNGETLYDYPTIQDYISSSKPPNNEPLSDSIPTLERQYHKPFDARETYKHTDTPPQESKPKQMWNKHTGVHDESVLCTGMKCQEYNPINIEHK